MKKLSGKILIVLFGFLLPFVIQAQTLLPASWDCSPESIPDGWTTNISDYYVSSAYYHSPPNAAKFEATGKYITVHFVDKPDSLKYYLRGASFSGGTFSVQQSQNGSTWTDVRIFTNANIPNSSLQTAQPFKEKLLSVTRYVRFIYTNKSGGNVAVDDIMITPLPPGPEAYIKIKLNNIFIPSGGTAVYGNASPVNFIVINQGTDSTLRLNSAVFSGVDASMFSCPDIPLNIPPNDSVFLAVHFSPSGASGTKTASISISNNDSGNNPYILNLWAVNGCCATEPTQAATNLNFSYVKSYKFRVNFSDGTTPPEKYLVLKKSSPITEQPLDGQSYRKGEYIGDAQVVYIGPAGYFYPSNVIANTHYYIKIFSLNGFQGYENYLTSAIAAADTTTPENMIEDYYDSIDELSPTLWQDLHTLINNHYSQYYSNYTSYLVDNFESRDTLTDGYSRKVITCAYSGENYVYSEPFAFLYFSREHNFCQSWMPTSNDANFTDFPEYSDYHNLMPVNQNKINVYRLNYPLGKVVTIQYQYLDAKKGLDSSGNVVFEPRDKIKGDCARSMFYQILCYDGVNGNDWYLPTVVDSATMYGQNESLLKQWNLQDPPDNYEIARNDYIHSLQQNRNPFIDKPEWANKFGFGVYSGLDENKKQTGDVRISPNPNDGAFTIFNDTQKDSFFEIFDIMGKRIFATNLKSGFFQKIKLQELNSGIYLYKVKDKLNFFETGKIIILK